MKILRIIASMNPISGGPCQGIRNSISEMKALGVHNEVLSLDAADAPFLAHDNFPVHAIGPGRGPWAYSANLLPWLSENLNRFDVVIMHGLWLYPSYAVKKAIDLYALTGPAAPPRLFIMPHGMLDPYFQRASGRRLKAIRNWFYWKLVESKVVNGADGLLFTCEQERRLAREPFHPYRPKKEFVVGMGVQSPPVYEPDMQGAFAARCPGAEGRSYLLFLSRIHNKKGVELLIEAYGALTRRLGKAAPPAGGLPHLVIAGPGLETPYGMRMQQLVCGSEELRGKVHFPGMLTGEAKWGAFYGCEAFILPSHQENFGIAVAEAMACGKPVLISDQVNIWREIEAAGGGIIASDTQAGTLSLLERWQALAEKGKKQMGSDAKAAYENKFALEPNVKRLLKVIAQR